MAKPVLTVAVLGDSAMWGQGLREKEKYVTRSVAQIAGLLENRANIAVNSARSGAVICAGRTSTEARKARREFVDLYPHLFAANAALASRFLIDAADDTQSQNVALELYGEIPCSFPTVEKQVQRVVPSVAQETQLVLLNGGANDIDFEEFLDPTEFRDNFVEHFDAILKDIAFDRVRSLLEQARLKFPHAVILFTGYYAPFAPDVSNSELKTLFESRASAPPFLIWSNNYIELRDIDRLVLEAQHRAVFGASRALYWTTKAVAQMNDDPTLRGPGIIFIHPRFGPDNTVFAAQSFFHREYEPSDVKDAARKERVNNCPREEYFNEIRAAWFSLSQGFFSADMATSLRRTLNGPSELLRALDRLAQNPADASDREDASSALFAELKRIARVRIASFLHPNERGAQRYTEVITHRYIERSRRITLKDDLAKLRAADADSATRGIRHCLRRYGFGPSVSLRAMSPMILVDSIALEVVTSLDSEADMYDNVFLDMGSSNRWQLNFPYYEIRPAGSAPVLLRILHRFFRPGATDLFTLDAGGTHLGTLTQFVLESEPTSLSRGKFRPAKVTLFVNGTEVFSTVFFGNMSPGGRLSFPYPHQG